MGQPLNPDHDPAAVSQPGIGPFHLPPLAIPREVGCPAGTRLFDLPLGNARLDPSPSQADSQEATVVCFVRHQLLGAGPRPTTQPGYFTQ
jgi:hypothetical protein